MDGREVGDRHRLAVLQRREIALPQVVHPLATLVRGMNVDVDDVDLHHFAEAGERRGRGLLGAEERRGAAKKQRQGEPGFHVRDSSREIIRQRKAASGRPRAVSAKLPSGPKPPPVTRSSPFTATFKRWKREKPLTGSDARQETAKFQTPWATVAPHRLPLRSTSAARTSPARTTLTRAAALTSGLVAWSSANRTEEARAATNGRQRSRRAW